MSYSIDFDGVHRRGARVAVLALCMMLPTIAGAHHVIGGNIPSSVVEGLLSGLAHPILGLDHFAFVVAAGLIAALHRRGAFVPVAFAAASLIGTWIHLLSWDLPVPELMISSSVVLFGVLLVVGQLNLSFVIVLAGASGIFHGYAYGEAIVGAEMTPLWAYLLGLTIIQIAVGLVTQWLFQKALRPPSSRASVTLRLTGMAIGLVGLGFLVT